MVHKVTTSSSRVKVWSKPLDTM